MNIGSRVMVQAEFVRPHVAPRMVARVCMLAALFVVELITISIRFDTQALQGRRGLSGWIGDLGPHFLQSLLVFAVAFTAFGYSEAKKTQAVDQLADTPFRWRFLASHALAMGAFTLLSTRLFASKADAFDSLVAAAWIASGVAGIATALFFFFPLATLRHILRGTGSAWIYATAAAMATPLLVIASGRLWKPATALTFSLVKTFLQPFVSAMVADPASWTLGSRQFSVQISPMCSGMEGMGLMLVFGSVWLFFFHYNYRFPRALLLIPAGMVLIFLLNSLRITALILIGNAGAPGVALGGFHSQAGWIAFNGLALVMACVAHRTPWISARQTSAAVDDRAAENLTAAYLAPFLAILAASMISGASSAGFEWLYPLRFVAAAAALFVFRRQYRTINWRFGWAALLIGGLVFLLWIFLDRVTGIPAKSTIAAGLASWSQPVRIAWLTSRTLAAIVTVPIAEELAFRGFLVRRFISANFESVRLQRWTLLAVAASSLAFGLLHGERWIAGTLAGFLYAGAQKWRGRIGEAVAAHAITNALIAVYVLWGGHWSLW